MSSVAKLIEHQAAMSDLRDRAGVTRHQPGSCMVGGVTYGPCLLMSRECGSGGGLVAHQVGHRLGWKVYDSELVDAIAKASNTRERLVQSVDEHVRSAWERTWSSILIDALPGGDLAPEQYLYWLRQVVISLGHHGNVVIVGRGAQYLLPPACCLRVRMIAPLELRIKRVTESEGLKPDQARKKVRNLDAERASFIRKTFRSDVDLPQNYDLVINTGNVSTAVSVELVLCALQQKFGVAVPS